MSTTIEEQIKKLDRRVSSLEKQIQDILKIIKTMQMQINCPPSPGFDREVQPERPRRQ